MSKATVVKIDGTEQVLDHQPTLKEAQEIVGGYIELVKVAGNKTLVVDEEGKLKHKPTNKIITDRYGNYLIGDYIVGDVIVLEDWKE